MDMAARAASPNAPALTLSATEASDARPCLDRDGSPILTMST